MVLDCSYPCVAGEGSPVGETVHPLEVLLEQEEEEAGLGGVAALGKLVGVAALLGWGGESSAANMSASGTHLQDQHACVGVFWGESWLTQLSDILLLLVWGCP